METLEAVEAAHKAGHAMAGMGSEALLLTFVVLCIVVLVWIGRYFITRVELDSQEARVAIAQLVKEKNEASERFQRELIRIIGEQNQTAQHLAGCLERNAEALDRNERAFQTVITAIGKCSK